MSQANTNYFNECKSEYGSVVYDGVEYAPIQQPFASDDGKTYQASALSLAMLNDAGDTPEEHSAGVDGVATIFWEITCPDSDDESNACDWEQALEVTGG